MSVLVMGSGGGLNNTKLRLADADSTDVLKGKKFYSGDKTLKTGTLELTGTASAGDVLSGATFYNTNAKSKQTGTLSLTGTAGAGDVLKGSTFYNTNAKSKVTGTLELTGTATAGDVLVDATFYNTNAKTKITGTLALTGNASEAVVLDGYTFYSTDAKTKRTGSMPNNGDLNKTYSGDDIALSAGYYTAGTFSVDGGKQSLRKVVGIGGTITIPKGWYDGTGYVSGPGLNYAESQQDASGGRFSYTLTAGTLAGITSISLPNSAYQDTGTGVSAWISGNTIRVDIGGISGYVTVKVGYVWY